MPETNDDEFTFTIEDNEYIIKKNNSSKNKQRKNLIHGPKARFSQSLSQHLLANPVMVSEVFSKTEVKSDHQTRQR